MFNTNCALYRNLTADELQLLAQHVKLKVLPKQQYLVTQHSPSEYVYNLASGAAAVERISSDGRRQILSFIFPCDFVGLSNTDFFEFGVKSLTNLTVHQFQSNKLFALSKEIPTLEENIKNIRGLVLGHMVDQLYLLGQKKAHERLCFLLVHLLDRLPGTKAEHVELPMTRLDIADFLGLTVETVSRSMTKLKQEGLISINNPNAVSILDLDAVRELASID